MKHRFTADAAEDLAYWKSTMLGRLNGSSCFWKILKPTIRRVLVNLNCYVIKNRDCGRAG